MLVRGRQRTLPSQPRAVHQRQADDARSREDEVRGGGGRFIRRGRRDDQRPPVRRRGGHPARPPVAAKAVSVVLATAVAYLGNRYWTFRHRSRSGRGLGYASSRPKRRGLGIALGCLGVFSHYVL